ncbi:TcfC E-set like domain-containing protein [Dongshaea marina]|uniref:TcfC E-set like domain-containing protein n=1 Tax=Dongshaea marina TaxID=2047966 RepID=UPI00131EECBE|nr:TcfC E-set like domain-containing protein [Dongshaea marina]
MPVKEPIYPQWLRPTQHKVIHQGASTEKAPEKSLISASGEQLVLSPEIKAMFESGLPLPIYLQVAGQSINPDSPQIGTATLTLNGNKYVLSEISIHLEEDKFELTTSLLHQLENSKNIQLRPNGAVTLKSGAELQFIPAQMTLRLQVEQSSFATTRKAKNDELGSSSTHELTGTLNYDLNAYHADSGSNGSLNLDSYTSFEEHHLNLDGSLFFGDEGKDQGTLDTLLYERDYHGYRVATGLLDGGSIQSLGNVSTLDYNTVYGASFGNAAESSRATKSSSLIPIILYFSTPGEARVYRNNKLIDIQRFELGSHELDTRDFPQGNYQVRVDIVTAGTVSSSRLYRVNKPMNYQQGDDLKWQLWGGMAKRSRTFSQVDAMLQTNLQTEEETKSLLGLSLASHIKDVLWSASLYQNGDTLVEEGQITLPLLSSLSVELGNLMASDNGRSYSATLNYDLPWQLGQTWFTHQDGHPGDREDLQGYFYTHAKSFGMSLNVGRMISGAGTLNASYEISDDLNFDDSGYQATQLTYQQQIYNSRYVNIQMTIGYNRNESTGSNNVSENYYGTLLFSIPLDYSLSLGLSHHEDGDSLDLSVEKQMDGFVTSAGADLSSDFDEQNSYNLYANYDGHYAQGMVSAQGDEQNHSVSISNSGSLAWTPHQAAPGDQQSESGLIVIMPEHIESGDTEVVVNDISYPLRSGRNFIPVDGYSRYTAYVRTAPTALEPTNWGLAMRVTPSTLAM